MSMDPRDPDYDREPEPEELAPRQPSEAATVLANELEDLFADTLERRENWQAGFDKAIAILDAFALSQRNAALEEAKGKMSCWVDYDKIRALIAAKRS